MFYVLTRDLENVIDILAGMLSVGNLQPFSFYTTLSYPRKYPPSKPRSLGLFFLLDSWKPKNKEK